MWYKYAAAIVALIITVIIMLIVYYTVYKKADKNIMNWYYGIGTLAIVPAFGLATAAYILYQ